MSSWVGIIKKITRYSGPYSLLELLPNLFFGLRLQRMKIVSLEQNQIEKNGKKDPAKRRLEPELTAAGDKFLTFHSWMPSIFLD